MTTTTPPQSWAPSMRWTRMASSPPSPTTCASASTTVLDGADVTLPVVSVLRLRDHLVTDYRVYVDQAPVHA